MLYGKTVAILSGGLSLAAHFARGQEFMEELDEYETLIAVNHNVEKVTADWWVFNDPNVFFQTKEIKGCPAVFARKDWTPGQMDWRGPMWLLWPRVWQEQCNFWVPRVDPAGSVPIYTSPTYRDFSTPIEHKANLPCWNKFGGLSALGLAWLLKPESVALYGYDNAGTAGVNDADHPDVPRNRDVNRWATEVKIFAWYMEIFAEAKISVAKI